MIKEAILMFVEGQSLTIKQAEQVMEEIMNGQATPAQFGAFVTSLRLKGETVDEIVGMAKIMRAKAIRLDIDDQLVDTCGTGGDASGTFNISTAAAFVVAGAGLKVAKHGNRAMSSQCGSADVLEALGIKIDCDADGVKKCIDEVGIGFIFAPLFHPAMKYAAALRREIGIRTIFNLIGPLTNPAGADVQVIGVANEAIMEKIVMALKLLGCRHALVVHGEDGLDEITICGGSLIYELKGDKIRRYYINPKDLGLLEASQDSLKGGSAIENAAILRCVLSGDKGPQRDVTLLNAAAVLLAGCRVKHLYEGIKLAEEVIDSGKAMQKLTKLADISNI
jgi:anthranilate phosphoribosyltransferase